MPQVLIADDDPQVSELIRRSLSEAGLSCDLAADGKEAIDLFNTKPYEAVVTDLRMPREHGYKLATDLLGRSQPPCVVVITGLRDQRLFSDLVGKGVDEVYWKPFDYNVLAKRVGPLIERRRALLNVPQAIEVDETAALLERTEKALIEISGICSDKLADLFEFEKELSAPPAAVTSFIERFAEVDRQEASRSGSAEADRRVGARVACPTSAIVVPLDDERDPQPGAAFTAAIQDISEQGIRLLHTRPIDQPYLAVGWRAHTNRFADIRLIAKVSWCRPRGPFYNLAGEFVLAD